MTFVLKISCIVPFQYSIASTSNGLTTNDISPYDCPGSSKRLLWLPRTMYLSTRKPLYLSSVLFTKSSKIYRCWIIWNKNICVAILPSILAITYLGQTIYHPHLPVISRFNLSLLATWIGTAATASVLQVVHPYYDAWGFPVLLTSFSASMAVNTLVTGLIVFKILKVFLQVRAATSVERSLGSLATGSPKLRYIIFVIIESGMALFAIQLVRVVLYKLPVQSVPVMNGINLVIGIYQMVNVIIRPVHFYFFCFTDNIYLVTNRASHQQ